MQFVNELNRIVQKSGMSLNAVAGNARPQLWRALRGELRPSEQTLTNWCYTWYRVGVITGDEATRLMNLAGYAAPGQQCLAHAATTEHRIAAITHVTTDELSPYHAKK